MKIETKKTIAREFLIFLACVAIAILSFLGTFLYNAIYERKVQRIENSMTPINQEITELEQPYKEKINRQKWFFNESKKRDFNGGYKNYSTLWNRLEEIHKTDSVVYKWNNVWEKEMKKVIGEIGFKTGEEFDKFISDNLPNKDDVSNQSNVEKLRKEINKLESQKYRNKYQLLERKGQMHFASTVFLVLIAISFPLRYLFLSIRWSIKTLKQKE